MALDTNRKAQAIIFVALVGLTLLIRLSLRHVQTSDYIGFLNPWIEHMKQFGIAGIGNINSNYNAPYLILLWIVGHLPFSNLFSVKLISIIFDYILAGSVFLVVRFYKPIGITKYVSFLAILFAPTVIINGSLWAQCDVIYTSFIVLSFYAFLKNRLHTSWILWGISFAFKLQSVFFLPFLLFGLFYKKRGFLGPIYAAAVIVALSILPMFYGRSLADVINVYVSQTSPNGDGQYFVLFAPTIFQIFTISSIEPVRKAMILIAGSFALGLASLAFLRKFNAKSVLILAVLIVLSLPFLLPQMHERYFYVAEIFLIMAACIIPKLIIPAIGMQVITVMSYIPYLSGYNQGPGVPYVYLALAVLSMIVYLIYLLYKSTQRLEVKA